jgi:hypothetical protein
MLTGARSGLPGGRSSFYNSRRKHEWSELAEEHHVGGFRPQSIPGAKSASYLLQKDYRLVSEVHLPGRDKTGLDL